MNFADRIKSKARELGFDRAGFAAASDADGFDRLQEWLARGFGGEMAYLQPASRRHPRSILAEVRSVLMVSLNYNPPQVPPAAEHLHVARYALGGDYHEILRDKLNTLLAWIQSERPETRGRGVVDTAPLLERDFARRAGLGWFGKNTMLIHPKLGSYFFLGALLLDLDLPADPPFAANHCGTCTRCLDACPTDAFVGPGWLDSRRCISYLTIELRGPIPEDLREGLGSWAFGCDICQQVCPWNRKAPPANDPDLAPRPDLLAPDLIELLGIDDAEFRRRFRGTALFRAKRRGLLRNIALVLGNLGVVAALPALEKLAADADPMLQEAARWAIERVRVGYMK